MSTKSAKVTIPDDSANRNAQPPAREPDPVPEGNLFTVQGFRQDGTRVEGKAAPATTHADAIERCKTSNESPAAKSGAVWFGVVPASDGAQ